jgi:hypothetical protein
MATFGLTQPCVPSFEGKKTEGEKQGRPWMLLEKTLLWTLEVYRETAGPR